MRPRMRTWLAFLVGFALLQACSITHPSATATLASALTGDQMLSLLRAHRFAELDRHYSQLQREYERGAISDWSLGQAFGVFSDTDSALESGYNAWVEHFPNSYVAHLARAYYHVELARERRGHGWAKDTSESQFAGMRAALALAVSDLNQSLALTSKPILTYRRSIQVAQFSGRPEAIRPLLDLSIEIDPHNVVVRQAYMATLSRVWYGSHEQMVAFFEQSRAALSPADQMRLQGVIYAEQAYIGLYVDMDYQSTIENAQLAYDAEADPVYIGWMTNAYFRLNQCDKAIEMATVFLATKPMHPAGFLVIRGQCYLREDKYQDGLKDYQQAAQLGYASAQDMVGRIYLWGLPGTVSPDRAEAIAWLNKSAAQGFAPAQRLLPKALDLSSTPPQEMQ